MTYDPTPEDSFTKKKSKDAIIFGAKKDVLQYM